MCPKKGDQAPETRDPKPRSLSPEGRPTCSALLRAAEAPRFATLNRTLTRCIHRACSCCSHGTCTGDSAARGWSTISTREMSLPGGGGLSLRMHQQQQ